MLQCNLKMVYRMVNPSTQYQRTVSQFFEVKGISLLKFMPRWVLRIEHCGGGSAPCAPIVHAASAGYPKTRIGSYCCWSGRHCMNPVWYAWGQRSDCSFPVSGIEYEHDSVHAIVWDLEYYKAWYTWFHVCCHTHKEHGMTVSLQQL
jgi:hypothetical protein